MSIERDEQGFLIGSRIGTDEIVGRLGTIHDELKAIRAALGSASGSKAVPAPTPARGGDIVPAAAPASRRDDSLVRILRAANDSSRTTPAPTAAPDTRTPVAATTGEASVARRRPEVERAVRDRSGRFVGRNGKGGSAGSDPGKSDDEGSALGRAVSDMGARVAGAVSEIGAGSEEADPSVKAFNEIAQPLSRGFGKIFGGGDGDRKQDRWYRRFWREMTQKSRDDKAAAKESQRSLRDIERAAAGDEEGGGGGGGLLGMLGPLLLKIPGIAMLGSLGGSLLKMVGPMLMRGLSGVGSALTKGIGGLMKSGVSGFLAKLALPAAGIMAAVKGFNTTTEEYAARMGVELNGGLAQALGVRFVGVLGDLGNTLTFGLAGKFGEMIAPAISGSIEAMVGAWTATTDFASQTWASMGEGWNATLGWFKGIWDGALRKVGEWIDGIANFGKDTKQTIIKTTERVVERVGDVKEGVSGWVSGKADQVASSFGGGSKARKQALQVEMANSGITDPREQAMFMAQMDHESGGFKATEESFNYRSADRLMAVSGSARKHGKPAVEAAMAQGPEAIAELMYGGRMGNTEKGDAHKYRGRGAIQLTGKDNYAAASKDLGLDLVSNPELAEDPAVAAKVATWYWKKNNLGEAARKGDVTSVTKRINGGTNGLADRNSKYQAYLATANTGKLSLDGGKVSVGSVAPTAMPMAVDRNAASELPPEPVAHYGQDARELADAYAPKVSRHVTLENGGARRAIDSGRVVVAPGGIITPPPAAPSAPAATASPPSVPSVRTASMAVIPDAPSIPVPMGADAGVKGAQQSRPAEVSRDVPDRRIAHVVTGAYSGMY